jgi:hypothetical protein
MISRSNTKVTVTRSTFWYPRKGLVTRNTPVKCQSSSTCLSKGIAKVRVFSKVKHQSQAQKVEKYVCPWKGLVTRNTKILRSF